MNEENNNQHTNQQPEEATPESTQANIFAEQLKECEGQRDEWKDRYIRSIAEFENYKKRTEKEKMIWMSSAQSSLLHDLLAIVDDFDRAFAQPQETAQQSLVGFELIYKSLQKLLEKYGVTEIKDNTQFDPAKHEAIMQVEAVDKQSGDIVQVLQKGYLFKGEVLRPAKVSVAK
jgi:molecular chaperone GrpE